MLRDQLRRRLAHVCRCRETPVIMIAHDMDAVLALTDGAAGNDGRMDGEAAVRNGRRHVPARRALAPQGDDAPDPERELRIQILLRVPVI